MVLQVCDLVRAPIKYHGAIKNEIDIFFYHPIGILKSEVKLDRGYLLVRQRRV
jgi:hypothetical protein